MRPLIRFYLLIRIFLSCLVPLLVSAQGEGYLQEIDQLPEEEQLFAYRMLVDKNPQNARFQNSLGFCYYRMEDYDMAEEHYTTALTLDPAYSAVYNNLGVVYLKKGQYDESKHYFEKALQYNSHNVKAMYNLGVTHFREGNYFKALRCYLKAKRMDANYVKERGDEEKVKKEVGEALKKDPESPILKKASSHLNH